MKTYSNSILSAEEVKKQFEAADQAFQIKLDQLEKQISDEQAVRQEETRCCHRLVKIAIIFGFTSLILNILQLTNVL